MNKEELIKKWLNDDLNATDREAFEALDDSVFNEKICRAIGAEGYASYILSRCSC